MCAYTASAAKSANIISGEPHVIKCFYLLIPVHFLGGRSIVMITHYMSADIFQLISSLFSHSQLLEDAFPTAFAVFFQPLPLTPRFPNLLHRTGLQILLLPLVQETPNTSIHVVGTAPFNSQPLYILDLLAFESLILRIWFPREQ